MRVGVLHGRLSTAGRDPTVGSPVFSDCGLLSAAGEVGRWNGLRGLVRSWDTWRRAARGDRLGEFIGTDRGRDADRPRPGLCGARTAGHRDHLGGVMGQRLQRLLGRVGAAGGPGG